MRGWVMITGLQGWLEGPEGPVGTVGLGQGGSSQLTGMLRIGFVLCLLWGTCTGCAPLGRWDRGEDGLGSGWPASSQALGGAETIPSPSGILGSGGQSTSAPDGFSRRWLGQSRVAETPSPAQRRAIREEALQAIDREDWASAYRLLLGMLDQEPDSPELHCRLGRVLLGLGDPVRAERILQRAVRLDPDYADALVALGRARTQMNRIHDGLALYDQAIEVAPHHHEAHRLKAENLEALGQIEAALTAYYQALPYQRQSTSILIRIAALHRRRGHLEEALVRLDGAMENEPDNIKTLCLRGLVLLDLEQDDDALIDLRRAVEIAPDKPETHVALGQAYRELGRNDQALQALDRALELDPDDRLAHELADEIRTLR